MKIVLNNINKTFGAVKALDGVSLTLQSGQRTALIGPNGSGKSTLMRIIMGMLACEGEVRLDDCSPLGQRTQLAPRIAYVPQVAPQLRATVAELLHTMALTRGWPAERVQEIASQLDLDLNAVADRPLRALSSGMKQKLLIAMALAAEASLLIMDEPTASLDAAAREAFFKLYERIAGEATLILCSHRLDEIQHLVDHVVELENGQIIFDGPVGDFLRARVRSIVELYTADDRHAGWLRQHGFTRGSGGGWARIVARGEKIPLLREITDHFHDDTPDVVIRDMGEIEPNR